MSALSGGHLAVDFASGSVPALIPFMTDRFHLGYALAAMLLLTATASSSLVQPLFGLWSDRRGALWLIPGGTLLAAVGVGGAAISPAYPLVLLLVLAGGLGVAAFHPEGSKFAAYASGRKRASGMSYFNSGGNAGYALGAFATGQLVVWLGLVGGLVAMVPVFVASLALLRVRAASLAAHARDAGASAFDRGDDRRRAMALLGVVIALRSVAWFTLLAFVPLWVVSLGHSKADGNRLLFLMLLAGAAGTLLLGPVADRIGLRVTLVITQALLTPLILVVRLRRRRARRARADAGRRLRRRHVRRDDGAEPALPAPACRHGIRASRSGWRWASAASPRSRPARSPTRST